MDLRGQNIICISFPNWEGDYSKTIVQVMSRLGQNNRVLYVNYEFTLKDILLGILGFKEVPVWRVLGVQNRLVNIRKKGVGEINILNPPPVLPINWIKNPKLYQYALDINTWIVKRCIDKHVKRLRMDNPIIVNAFNPFYGLPFKGIWNEKLHLYYCYDEISGAHWIKEHGPDLEKDFIQKIDAVITTSPKLYETKSQLNKKCYLIPNGVDYKLFSKGIPQKVYRPIIGYIGVIDDRIDQDLMFHLVTRFKDYDFWFVGPIKEMSFYNLVKDFYNVQFLGAKQPYELPDLAATFSVGIIPFVKNTLTQSINPLKLNEYLSTGIPVVSTDFSDLSTFSEVISISKDKKMFCDMIESSIRLNSSDKIRSRMEVAKRNSWENRVHELEDLIHGLIKEKEVRKAS